MICLRPAPGAKRRLGPPCLVAATVLAMAWPALAPAQSAGQTPNASGIYSCVDARGRRHTADRPIPECMDREQEVRRTDGSVRDRLPPAYTPEERARLDEARRRTEQVESAQRERVRQDRQLLARYPDVAAHQRARDAALEPLRKAERANEERLATLERERKALADEAEFYPRGDLPRSLRSRIDTNRATIEALHSAAANREAETNRINQFYDEELARLRRLWAGAAPGSAAVAGASGPGLPR